MSSGDFGTFVPFFWKLHPALVGFLVFAIDFGAIMLIRVFGERKFYFSRFWSFKIGDTIGLPVLAGFASIVVSDGNFTGFYTELWWHILVICLGYVISFSLQVNNLLTGFFTWEDVRNPSEVWHTFIFGVMFYLVVTVLFAVAADREPVWAAVLAFTGLGVWVLGVAIDRSPWVDKSPGRISPNETVIVLRRERGI
ncbi:MAG TPA: hypothetical protein VF303_02200 [Candidatus Nanoarchaeia archaeon]